MTLRIIPIVALAATLGLAACQEEGGDTGEATDTGATEMQEETGTAEEGTTESN